MICILSTLLYISIRRYRKLTERIDVLENNQMEDLSMLCDFLRDKFGKEFVPYYTNCNRDPDGTRWYSRIGRPKLGEKLDV